MKAASAVMLLQDVILSYFLEESLNRTPNTLVVVKETILKYIHGVINFQVAASTCFQLTGQSEPIEKLRAILEMRPEPIPYPIEYQMSIESHRNRKKSRSWTEYEDQRLLAGVLRSGVDNWTSISRFVGNGRTRSQCSQRWYRGLDPRISKEPWSKLEEEKLMSLVKQYGEKSWTLIASKMINRSDAQCRYHYMQMQAEGFEPSRFGVDSKGGTPGSANHVTLTSASPEKDSTPQGKEEPHKVSTVMTNSSTPMSEATSMNDASQKGSNFGMTEKETPPGSKLIRNSDGKNDNANENANQSSEKAYVSIVRAPAFNPSMFSVY